MGVMIERKKRIMMMQMQGGGLPAEYQRVEYVENPDKAYIVTDFSNYDVDRADCDFYYVTKRAWCSLLGSSKSLSDPVGNAVLLSHQGYTRLCVVSWTGAVQTDAISAGNRYVISAKFTSGEEQLKINEELIGTNNKTWSVEVPYMSLFGIYYGNISNKPGERALVRIYSCQFYGADGKLIEDFIPCYRKSDRVIGMYGNVTKTFYTNSGEGTFLKGNDVN